MTRLVCFLLPLLVALLSNPVWSAPQQRRLSQSQSGSNQNTRALLVRYLKNPPPPDFKIITFDLVAEFFKDPQLVKDLVRCFDIHDVCPHAGMEVFINALAENYSPTTGCSSCGKNFNRVIQFSRKQFENRYNNEWKELNRYLADFFF